MDIDWRTLLVEDKKEDLADDILDPEAGYGDFIDTLSRTETSIEEDAQRMIGCGEDDVDTDDDNENIDALELENFKDDFLDTGLALNTIW